MGKLAQMNMAKLYTTAAANQGGLAGAGMGIGVGFGMGNMMANTMGQSMNQMQQQATPPPPPIPQAVQYFAVVAGKQAGPFNEQQLAQMAQAGTLMRDTLVWKTGMASWLTAGQVPEMANVFGATPPPVPPGV